MADAKLGSAPSQKELTKQAVAERTPYYERRIELFGKYKERMEAAVEDSKAKVRVGRLDDARRVL